jgi:hypothetical protein
MDTERLAYADFQRHLVVRIAVLAGADFERPVFAEDAAIHIDGRFPASWIATVAIKLMEKGLIQVSGATEEGLFDIIGSNLSLPEKLKELSARKEMSRPQYALTEAGLVEAEKAARLLGFSLWDEIDRFEERGGSENIPETGRLVMLNRISPNYVEVEKKVRDTIQIIRSDNELMSSTDGAQRVAELEAGKALIQADQVNEGLVKRVLVPSLLWAARKMRDEASGTAIKILVTKLLELLTK